MSEESLAILRGDTQVATFHFLHHLANMKFGRTNVISSVAAAGLPGSGGAGAGGAAASGGMFAAGKGAPSSGSAVSVASSNAASTKVIYFTQAFSIQYLLNF